MIKASQPGTQQLANISGQKSPRDFTDFCSDAERLPGSFFLRITRFASHTTRRWLRNSLSPMISELERRRGHRMKGIIRRSAHIRTALRENQAVAPAR